MSSKFISRPTKIRDACINGGFYADDNMNFRDTSIYLHSSADGYLSIIADLGYIMTTTPTATGRALLANATTAAPNHGDGYGTFEFNLNTTGTVAGHIACASFWVNTSTGTTGTGNSFITPLTVGIYEESAASMAGSIAVCGMRASAVLGDTNFAALTVMSLNVADKTLTAFLHVNELSADNGYYANTGSAAAVSGCFRFLIGLTLTGVKYIHLYDSVS